MQDANNSSNLPADKNNNDIGALFNFYGGFLMRAVARYLGPGGSTEDIVQETFLTLHRKRDEIDLEKDLRGWLYRVAINHAQHYRRSTARFQRIKNALQDELPTRKEQWTDGDVKRREQSRQIWRCINEMPEAQREAFVLFEIEGLDGETVAQMLDISTNAVWMRLHKGRQKFRELWLGTKSSSTESEEKKP